MTLLLVAVVLIISSAIAVKKPLSSLGFAVFLIPWQGIDVDVGVRVTAYLAFVMPLFFVVSLRLILGSRRSFVHQGYVVYFLIFTYSVLVTFVMMNFAPSIGVAGGELRQGAIRGASQILMFAVQLSPLLIIPALVRNVSQIHDLLELYLKSVLILAAVGWLQLGVWYVTGSDPLPVGYFNAIFGGVADIRSGVFMYDNSQIYRMSSLGGEPKYLAASFVAGLLILQSKILNISYRKWAWLILFMSLVTTFSTSGLLGYIGATIVQIVINNDMNLVAKRHDLKAVNKNIVSGSLIACAIVVVYLINESSTILEILRQRTIDRVSSGEREWLEDYNQAILDFLIDNPLYAILGVGLGNAHLYAMDYIPDFAYHYMYGSVFVAKSWALRWVSEIGLLSFVMFSIWVFYIIKKGAIAEQNVSSHHVRGISAKVVLPLFALVLISGYVYLQFIYVISMVLVIISLRKRKVRSQY